MNKVRLLLIIGVAACLLAGCGRSEQFEAVEQICIKDAGKQAVMKTAQQVLGEMSFSIEKADALAGYIRTRPLEGGQFFELWRSDNIGAFNSGEANLHTVRRVVEMNITSEDGELCVDCVARTYRLSLPASGDTVVSHAYEVFTASEASLQKFELSDRQKKEMVWLELGNDEMLSTEILKRLDAAIRDGEGRDR
ncbi:hypothetical protein ACFL1G_01685 [Planctomycetota bacterium]